MILEIAKKVDRKHKGHSGFTLVELISVLAILAIIAAIALPRFAGIIETAKKKADDATLEILQRAVDLYMIEHDGNVPGESDIANDYIEGDWPKAQQGGSFVIDSDTGKVTIGRE
jgi:prepilin-type N-terminal cleavage/methylation domain-containing protein